MAVGTVLGSYEIVGPLGKGGMGEVYRARDTRLEREVAIKTLPASLAGDKERLARFEREAKLLASLNHAHIASVYGLGEHDGTLFIAMELVEGRTLEQRLEDGAIPVEAALRLGLQIAEALEAAHEKGVVHRDLKPANVMVTENDVVKVLDFGLAKAFSGDPDAASPAHSPALSLAMTQQGLVLGTAGYMSPEQASGQATDQRADVWAFGVVLYEMLTGLPLFSGESVPHILADVLRTEPNWARLPKNLHPRIRALLERCLVKKPRQRYAGIADPRTDIEAALKDPDGVLVERVAGSGARAVPLQRRLLPWVAAVVVAVLAGFAAWTLKAPEARPVIRSSIALAEGEEWLVPQAAVIDISPDGQRIVYNTTVGLRLRSVDSFESASIPGIGPNRAGPKFSPDGQSIAIGTQGPPSASGVPQYEASIIPVTGGAARSLAITGDANDGANGMSWVSDGTILYAKADGVWRLPDNGGAPERIIEVAAGHATGFPSLLPGGEWVLFSLVRGEPPFDWDTAEIVAESLATGERRTLYSGGSAARYVPTGHLIYAFGNTLYALPFDADAIETRARSAIPVVSGVRREGGSGLAHYGFSENGTLIYLPGDTVQRDVTGLGILNPNGWGTSPLPIPGGEYADPRVSPDGSRAAYTRVFPEGSDIEVYDLSRNASPRRLTFGGTSRFPLWSADGTRVVFQSTRDGTASLYWQLADGSGGEPERLTSAADGEIHSADSFSPDGSLLTFTVARSTVASIWTLDPATGDTEELIAVPGQHVSQSVFSPDGRWIAYQSNETGNFNIFVQPYPLTGARNQLPPTVDNHHPAFSHDGSEIFYFPAQSRTESIPVSTGAGFSFGTAEVLPNWPMNSQPVTRRQYDVLPDGSGILGPIFPSGTETGPPEIRIVYNWFEELGALVPVD